MYFYFRENNLYLFFTLDFLRWGIYISKMASNGKDVNQHFFTVFATLMMYIIHHFLN